MKELNICTKNIKQNLNSVNDMIIWFKYIPNNLSQIQLMIHSSSLPQNIELLNFIYFIDKNRISFWNHQLYLNDWSSFDVSKTLYVSVSLGHQIHSTSRAMMLPIDCDSFSASASSGNTWLTRRWTSDRVYVNLWDLWAKTSAIGWQHSSSKQW